MTTKAFRAFVVEERDGTWLRRIASRTTDDLPAGDLLVRVAYSSLNYKDALSATGNKGVTRHYPHTPGIDAAGTVEHSDAAGFQSGDSVIVTGYDLGMDTDGGFGEYIRVPAQWAVKLPQGLTLREAMIFGTAGFTAGLSVAQIVARIRPEDGEILVSGATGGVGSMSIAILAKLGYRVAALTGKIEEQPYLQRLGAQRVLPRQDYSQSTARSILQGLWAGAIDTVGGAILENVIKSVRSRGVVTCCGNVASPDLRLTVYPFILRGISLVGIDSQSYPMELRGELWNRLAGEWKPAGLEGMCSEKVLEDLDACIEKMLAGRMQGRVLVHVRER